MKVKNRTAVVGIRRRRTSKTRLFKQNAVRPTIEAAQEKIDSPTPEELAKAKALIDRGLARAKEVPARPPEEIWAEFEEVRARIAAKVSGSQSES